MTDYRRHRQKGGSYFFTVVTEGRRPFLAGDASVARLREAMRLVMASHPFSVEAMVVLPDHLHALWSLPEGDDDFSLRWRLIKYRFSLATPVGWAEQSDAHPRPSLQRRREKGLWQRRFWEHCVRDEEDFRRHVEYIHYNPVRHGLAASPADWPYSSLHRFVRHGVIPPDWGEGGEPMRLHNMREAGE